MSQAVCDPSHVFVYGKLRRGGRNGINALAPAPRWLGTAEVAGTTYDFGRYPGVRLGGAGRVQGEVCAVTPELVVELDRIETVYPQQSDEYLRRELLVAVGNASVVCLVYEVNPKYVAGRSVIAAGDWMARDKA